MNSNLSRIPGEREEVFLKALLYIFFTLFIVLSAILLSDSGSGNPRAKDILSENPEADILKLDGVIYSTPSRIEATVGSEYEKGKKIGEIKKQTKNYWWFRDLYATKLPDGTKIFAAKGEDYQKGQALYSVIVELNNELVLYKALMEG